MFCSLRTCLLFSIRNVLWTTKKGIKTFGLKSEAFAKDTKVLAANQGLYNGFLAAGLVFSLIQKNPIFTVFFLICVTIAGIYGSYSTKQIKLFYAQAVPAIIALISYFYVNLNYYFSSVCL